jgi:hypothetical protein
MSNDTVNEFTIDSVFALSGEETSVTGHMGKGAFRPGESVSLLSASGIPLLASIRRIGTAETPVNVIREGQKNSLVLNVEPQHVVVGSKLTNTGNEDAAGATMIVDTGSSGEAVMKTADLDPELTECEQLVNARKHKEAQAKLDAYIQTHENSSVAHRLMGRVYLFGGQELRDEAKALEHVKRAYEAGGANDDAVLETLAQALGATGEADHGLRFLERLHAKADDTGIKRHYADLITSYRQRYRVKTLWEFVDGFGDVILESSSVEEIVKSIENGTIPQDAQCRKNRTGALVEMKDSIAKEVPAVGALFGGKAAGGGSSGKLQVVDIGIGMGVGVVLGLIVGPMVGMSFTIGAIAGLAVGGILGIIVTTIRSK